MGGRSDWQGYVQRSQSAHGSSIEFDRWLRANRPDLVVPEDEIVMIEGARCGWTPWDETPPQPGETCGKCGGASRGDSRLWCPKCQGSAFERELHEQRVLAGVPSPDPKLKDGKGGIG